MAKRRPFPEIATAITAPEPAPCPIRARLLAAAQRDRDLAEQALRSLAATYCGVGMTLATFLAEAGRLVRQRSTAQAILAHLETGADCPELGAVLEALDAVLAASKEE